jgi:hypothetical protein
MLLRAGRAIHAGATPDDAHPREPKPLSDRKRIRASLATHAAMRMSRLKPSRRYGAKVTHCAARTPQRDWLADCSGLYFEGLYRHFGNRREVAAYAGLPPRW